MADLGLAHYRPKTKQALDEKLGNNCHVNNISDFSKLRLGQPGGFLFSMVVYDNNVPAMTELFGKHEGIYRYEYNNYYWRFTYGGYIFTILTAAGKGTSIEVASEAVSKDASSVKVTVEAFVEMMHDLWKPFHQEDIDKLKQRIDV